MSEEKILNELREYKELRKEYKNKIGKGKNFSEIWEILFGDKNTVIPEEALPKIRALLHVKSNYTNKAAFNLNLKIDNKIGKIPNEQDFLINNILASALVLWLKDDEKGEIKKEIFIKIPSLFKQISIMIGSWKDTYDLQLTADAMNTIINTPGFINTFKDVDSNKLDECKYAIRKSKNYAFTMSFVDPVNDAIKNMGVNTIVSTDLINYFYDIGAQSVQSTNLIEIFENLIRLIRADLHCDPIPFDYYIIS